MTSCRGLVDKVYEKPLLLEVGSTPHQPVQASPQGCPESNELMIPLRYFLTTCKYVYAETDLGFFVGEGDLDDVNNFG